MSNQTAQTASKTVTETITKYETLFALRTGLTLMLPCVEAFNGCKEASISFTVSPENPRDIIITANSKKVLLKGLQKEHLDSSVARGFIMFYETKDDEVIRCTHCNYQKN